METTRRQILQALGVTLASTPLAPFVPGAESVAEAQTCVQTATETIGPYPNHTAFLRQDIREGRPGLPLQVVLTVVNTSSGRPGRTPRPRGCRSYSAGAVAVGMARRGAIGRTRVRM
jgi:hypothetical protein